LKSLVLLWLTLSEELGQWCSTSTTLDGKTVERRIETEGLSFLTITLPSFGTTFEQCLDKGCVEPGDFLGFKKSSGPLPRFLGGFLAQCFDRQSGLLRSDVNVDCVFAIRQLTKIFSKLQLPCADFRVRDAFKNYIRVEKEVTDGAYRLEPDDINRLARICTHLFGDIFSAISSEIAEGILIPKHGPGATAERKTSNQRYKHSEWPLRLEEVFPYLENALPNARFYQEQDLVHFPDSGSEKPVRVISVPKTMKTPRIIAIEPSPMQYMQQAMMASLVSKFESRVVLPNNRRNLCHMMIGFTDQVPNQEMAREGSLTGELATLDLSDASDRVSIQHVEILLHNFPLLLEAVMAVRSQRADVPGHGVIPLAKYASMGSALCFPIEAAVFLAVVFFGICKEEAPHRLRKEIDSYRDRVRVYGDDIIVPVDMVDSVVASLELFGFKVNANKSFWTGKFRESCGGDFYSGYDVTPVKLKKLFPSQHTDATEVISITEFRNHLYHRGLWKTAYWLDSRIDHVLHGHYPFVESTSQVIGRQSFLGLEDPKRTDRNLHVPLVKGYTLVSDPPKDSLDDWPALLKFFLKQGSDPLPKKHLERQGRPRVVSTKLGWMPPF
jgi:hypothetical protein